MAILLKLLAEVVQANNVTQTVAVLGDFILPIVQRTSELPGNWTTITGDYSYLAARCDDINFLGMPAFNDSVYDINLYMPMSAPYSRLANISGYKTSAYKLLLRDPKHPKNYIVSGGTLDSTQSLSFFSVYIDDTLKQSNLYNFQIPYFRWSSSSNYICFAVTIKSTVWDGVSKLSSISGNIPFTMWQVCKDKSGGSTNPAQWTRVRCTNYGEETTNQHFSDFLKGLTPYVVPTDPYSGAGFSGFSGGGGRLDASSDAIAIPSVPVFSASATGFMNLYKPTLAELNALAQYMWNTLDITQLKALFTNPMEAIVGLSAIPVSPSTGTSASIKLGNIDTGCTAAPITSQFVTIQCGSVNIEEFWGCYLDYDPYTKAEIFLPYIGTKDLDTNDIMGKTVTVEYHVDVLTGACVAFIKVGDAVLYHFSGHCSVQIPVTASSFGGVLQSAASMAWAGLEKVANALQGMPDNPFDVATSVFNAGRTRVSKSGAIGSAAGIMDTQKPYLIITRPKQSVPEDQNKFTGYPSNVTCTLGELTGYTEVESIHLENIAATGAELEELEAILKAGVLL